MLQEVKALAASQHLAFTEFLHRMFLNERDRYRERLEYLKINQYPTNHQIQYLLIISSQTMHRMDLRSKCPQCNDVQIIEIVPSNVSNTFDLNKARCNNCGYKYGSDWKDMI